MNRLALKFLDADGRGSFSRFEWPLPRGDKPGKWAKAEGELIPCRNGIHACTLGQVLNWLNARAYIIELDGRIIDAGNKLVARRGRLVRCLDKWDDTNARLFAADCGERVLKRKCPHDDRPRKAIEAARAYARGKITVASAAAAAAASAPCRDASVINAVAYATAYAAGAHGNAVNAATCAATDAAADTTTASDYAVAYASERRWQGNRLAHYLGLTATEKEAVS